MADQHKTKGMREKGVAYRVLVGKPEGRRPLGRPGRKSEDNIKMNFRKLEWVTWTDLCGSG
jgi:hypothetical protein